MIKAIMNSYKFFSIGMWWPRWATLCAAFFFTFLGIFIPNYPHIVNLEISIVDMSILVIIANTLLPHTIYLKEKKQYSKFLKTVPKAAQRYRTTFIINIPVAFFNFLMFYLVSGLILPLFINGYSLSFYKAFYLLCLGFFLVGIFMITVIHTKYCYFLTFMICSFIFNVILNPFIKGLYKAESLSGFLGIEKVDDIYSLISTAKSPVAIIITTLILIIFLCITYKISFIRMRKAW